MFDILDPGTGVDSSDIQLQCGKLSLSVDRYFTENRGLIGVCKYISNNCRTHADIVARKGKRIVWKKEMSWDFSVTTGTRAREIRDFLLHKGVGKWEIESKLPILTRHCTQR